VMEPKVLVLFLGSRFVSFLVKMFVMESE